MNRVVGNLCGRNQRLGRCVNLRRSCGGKKDRCEKQSTETSNAHKNHLVRATQPGGCLAKVVGGSYYNRRDKRVLQVQIKRLTGRWAGGPTRRTAWRKSHEFGRYGSRAIPGAEVGGRSLSPLVTKRKSYAPPPSQSRCDEELVAAK